MHMYNINVIHVHAGVYYCKVPNLQVVACESDKPYSGVTVSMSVLSPNQEHEYINRHKGTEQTNNGRYWVGPTLPRARLK